MADQYDKFNPGAARDEHREDKNKRDRDRGFDPRNISKEIRHSAAQMDNIEAEVKNRRVELQFRCPHTTGSGKNKDLFIVNAGNKTKDFIGMTGLPVYYCANCKAEIVICNFPRKDINNSFDMILMRGHQLKMICDGDDTENIKKIENCMRSVYYLRRLDEAITERTAKREQKNKNNNGPKRVWETARTSR